MTTTIELVSHVYAGTLPQYAAMFNYQASSVLVSQPKSCHVTLTVCYCQEDHRTVEIVEHFQKFNDAPTVFLNFKLMAHDDLMQRAIGRNEVAKETKADLIWFTDCDYCWAPKCFDQLAELYRSGQLPKLAYPRFTMVNARHEDGDAEIANALEVMPRHLVPRFSTYVARLNPRAIGGIQIVAGDDARRIGYCDGHRKFQAPAKTFQPMRSDREFRKQLGAGYGTPIDLLGVYRIRHSEIGYECNKRH